MTLNSIWNRLFLQERPSIGLSFFRIFVALTTGLHVIPSFFPLADNYLSTAFKEINPSFFTPQVLDLVAQSPDWLVVTLMWVFVLTWFCFLIGLFSQASCILMVLCSYYFYALNSFHIGTLSWDILLVTLFLMCVTGYHGDYFSVDALRRQDPQAWARKRPYFIQRLLQIQIAATYFFTALHKITGQGNWLTGNPMHALMNYPPEGVTKFFLIKEWLAGQEVLCYWIGIFIIIAELMLPFLLFIPKTRRAGILLGAIFHITLILTLDVPAIFFFLFPAQLLLFIDPKCWMDWIARRRARSYKLKLLYDGDCGFCKASVDRLKVMDLWDHLECEPSPLAISEVKLVDGDRTYGGYDAFARLCFVLPMMYPLLLLVYLPGAFWIGRWGYRLIANYRYLLHRQASCRANSCFRKPS